ncbi:MAG: ORF6N domain-containing protein [Verrucomicrobia bacterium]|nr:ORF6N domain-containing protein [Verrucomicrobiota bacterium]
MIFQRKIKECQSHPAGGERRLGQGKVGGGPISRRPAVRRNPTRFPNRFVLVVKRKEVAILISQNVISKIGRGGATKPPMTFTEHGALMVASVLNSARAISDE